MRRGRHRYLVARELIEADVVFNVPKLKTHKKAGVTGALKNLVGINGHKAYLPHHRKGGVRPRRRRLSRGLAWKAFAEDAYDVGQPSRPAAAPRLRSSDRQRCSSVPATAASRRPASRARGTATTPCGGCRSICSDCSATAALDGTMGDEPAASS